MIKLFGVPEFPVTLPRRAIELFGYVVTSCIRAKSRSAIGEELFTSKKALRQSLWALGDLKDHLDIGARHIGFHPNSQPIDVVRFEWGSDLKEYTAPFMLGFEDIEWVLWKRVELDTTFLMLATIELNVLRDHKDYEELVSLAEHVIKMEPTYEKAHQYLMAGLVLLDMPELALNHYEKYEETLRRTMDARPAKALRKFVKELRNH